MFGKGPRHSPGAPGHACHSGSEACSLSGKAYKAAESNRYRCWQVGSAKIHSFIRCHDISTTIMRACLAPSAVFVVDGPTTHHVAVMLRAICRYTCAHKTATQEDSNASR